MSDQPGSTQESLIRGLGVRQLAASIVNSTVGAGIFVVPALVAKDLGAAAIAAYLVCAVAMALIVTTVAMAGSRVSSTGGLFAYVETAFGPYVGFLAGAMLWVSGVTAAGGVSIAFLDALSGVVPTLQAPLARIVALGVMLTIFAAINVRGVRAGARTIELLTVAKLLPLLVFVGVGVFFIQPAALAWAGAPDTTSLGRGVLLLTFAFMGIEVALTPSGEVKDPARTVPRATYIALAVTTSLYIAIQLVAQGVLGSELAAHTDAPLAEASRGFLGTAGVSLLLAGTLVSMMGYVSGDSLCTSRLLYAFSRDGLIPATLARVHPVFRTPYVAIATHAVMVFMVASSGSFESVAIVSNVATLTLYLLACLASFALMRRDVRADGPPFVFRGAPVIAGAATAVILLIMSSATLKEFAATGAALAIASVLYLLRRGTRVAVAGV